MKKLNYISNIIYYLIIKNPKKIAILCTCIILFSFAGTIKEQTDKYDVVKTLNIKDKYIYIYTKDDTYNIKTLDKEINLENGVLKLKKYNEINIFLWILFSILTLFYLIFLFLADEDDRSWELEDCRYLSFSKLISCEEENGKFYYFAMDRLISIKENIVDQKYTCIARELGIDMTKIKRCPIYYTKQKKREMILNNILT